MGEYMFSIVFHPKNTVPLEDLPEEIQCLSPYYFLSKEGEDLLQLLTQK
jgi:hypothetical protein